MATKARAPRPVGGWSTIAGRRRPGPAMLAVLIAAAALHRAGAQSAPDDGPDADLDGRDSDGGGANDNELASAGLCNGRPDLGHCRLFVSFCDLPQVNRPCPVACNACIQPTTTATGTTTAPPAATTMATPTVSPATTVVRDGSGVGFPAPTHSQDHGGLIVITTPGHVDDDHHHDDADSDSAAGGHHDDSASDPADGGAGSSDADADAAHPVSPPHTVI